MESPSGHNRLADEPSPYLQQHADNPVHWQPWDDDALTSSSDRDVPIFCSIGYAACHWCHVMEEESFMDDRVASKLNAHFVPIKVDREERPDVDKIYQTICQLVTGSGGWPLSVFLTPDGRPFFVGTYYPPEPKRGRPGFLEILDRITETWNTDRSAIEARADQWNEALRNEVEVTTGSGTTPTNPATFTTVAQQLLQSVDDQHGGFGAHGPKFPQPTRINALLRASTRFDNPAYLDAAILTLERMANQGLYDHVGGGFHRYATDRAWQIPHFEKMLYDNAELARVYLRAYQRTKNSRFSTVAEETLAFVTEELQHPDGGFYSTLDAQSDGREGAFYVWTPETVGEAIADEEIASLIRARFGITKTGNFEHGTTVLTIDNTISELARSFDRSESTVKDMLSDGTEALRDARTERTRPARDEKILCGWNGLMISAFADAGLVLDATYIETAERAMRFIRNTLWEEDSSQLFRRYKDGDVGIDGYLDDYAFLARAALDLYQVSGQLTWLSFAVELADALVYEFWDPTDTTLYFTPQGGESLISRPQDPIDQSTPSSLAVACEVLETLHTFVPDRGFDDIVASILESYDAAITGAPLQHIGLAVVADRMDTGHLEWTIVSDEIPEEWRSVIGQTYRPDRLITRRPPQEESLDALKNILGIDSTPSIWSGRTQIDDTSTVYVCREFTCSPPLADINEALSWVEKLGT